MADEYVLKMENITKQFPGVKALDDVTFEVKRGEIHALVGENGAGKSTLMKIMSGVYRHGTFDGNIYVNGEKRRFETINDSEATGVVIIYQELGLVQTMNVCENIYLGHEIKRRGVINWDEQYRTTNKLLKEVKLGADVKGTSEVGTLGTGKQQLIEIAKALSKNVRVLILDEPTASLTERDSENLLNLLFELKGRGITCVFISHKLNEVMKIADTITVLRDGQSIVTLPKSEMSEDRMIAYMVGREMSERFPRVPHVAGEVALELRDWTAPHPEYKHRNLLDHIDFIARKGEIVGIAGLMGAGRTELALSVYGALKAHVKGQLFLSGKEYKPFREPKEAIKNGVGYLSEDRKRYGLVLTSDIRTNTTLASLDKISNRWIINRDEEVRRTNESVRKYLIKTPSIYQQAQNLSGGNQQKVALAKTILTEPKVLFLDEPTRGIDVGAKYEIYQLMNRLVDDGYCIIMISSELPEVIGMSDRIYTMHEGKITRELDANTDEITQEKLLYFMAGGK